MGILMYKGVNYSGGAGYDDTQIRELINQKIDKTEIGEGLEFDENNSLKIVDGLLASGTYSKEQISEIIIETKNDIVKELPVADSETVGVVKPGLSIVIDNDGTMNVATITDDEIDKMINKNKIN